MRPMTHNRSGEMAVSIKDIARVAGVAHSTVSRALRGSSLIPEVTANRIRRIAEEMGYTASAIGRGLVKGRTEAIGVVVTSISDPFNGEVVAGLEEVANEYGYSVILATSQALPEREISVVRAFQSRRVDGIVVASSRVGSNYSSMLADLQIPVVLLNNQHPYEFSYSVRIDNMQGSFDATNHLLSLGHRRIAYLSDKNGLHSDAERRAGFEKAMHAAGAAISPHLLLSGDGKMEGAIEATLKLFAQGDDLPTAAVCYNDMTAIGVMQAAKRMQLSIPGDLSLVGFDDIQVAELVTPALTTVRQPKRQLGMCSMRLLLKLLRGEETEHSLLLPGELIVRDSTVPVARAVTSRFD
jgi:DNA-binding LacI/PurR family transcriptional regulator